eukprot:s1677_g3.t2
MKSRREEKRRSFEDFEGQAWNWSREEPSQASERDAELVAPAAASEQAGRSRQVRSEENFPKKKKNHRGGRSEAKRTACGAERRECQRTNPTVLRENPDAPPGILAKTPPLKLQPGQSRPPSILPLSSTVRCRVLDSAQLFTNVASICTLCTEPCDRATAWEMRFGCALQLTSFAAVHFLGATSAYILRAVSVDPCCLCIIQKRGHEFGDKQL